MDKPLCRLCKTRHGSNEPHVFTAGANTGGRTDDAPPIGPGKETGQRLSQSERNRRWRSKNRERYNEYMRRYRREK